jgi:inhibitor of cysteine peptidase
VLVIDQSNVGASLDIPVGQTFELRLEENPSAGFRWTLNDSGMPACALASDSFKQQTATPGHLGEHSWTFKAVAAGDCNISLVYRRAWETTEQAARTFSVHVRVSQ